MNFIKNKRMVIFLIIVYCLIGGILYLDKQTVTIERTKMENGYVDSIDSDACISQKLPVSKGILKKLIIYIGFIDASPEARLNIYISRENKSPANSNIIAKKSFKCSELSAFETLELNLNTKLCTTQDNYLILEYSAPDNIGYMNLGFADNYHGAYRGGYTREHSLAYYAEVEGVSQNFIKWLIVTIAILVYEVWKYLIKRFCLIRKFIKKHENAISAILCVCIGYVVLCLFSAMTYYTNDDYGIQRILSMAEEGKLWWIHQFIGAWLSILVGNLYINIKGVPWWYIFHHIYLSLGISFFNYALFELSDRSSYSKKKTWMGVLLINICLFWYFITYASFTCSPAILCVGIIMLILVNPVKRLDKVHIILFYIGTIIMYAFALMMRIRVGLVLLPFLLLSIFISMVDEYLVCSDYRVLIKFTIVIMAYIVSTLALIVSSEKMTKKINGQEFLDFQSARIEYNDYIVDLYDENPELYNSVGWDECVGKIGSFVFFCNEKTDYSLKYIAENSKNSLLKMPFAKKIERSINYMLSYSQMRNLFVWTIVIEVVALASVIYNYLNKKINLLYFVLNNVGGLLITIYLMGINGRWIYRVEYIVFLPICVINIYFIICSSSLKLDNVKVTVFIKDKILCAISALEMILLACSLVMVCIQIPELFLNMDNMKNEEACQVIVKDYMNNHPDNIYVDHTYARSWKNPKSEIIYNSISDGGSSWKSAAWQQFCNIHGFENGINPDIFRSDNVYLIGTYDVVYLKYMMEHHNALGIAVVDRVDEVRDIDDSYNIEVMHFVYEDNKDSYDSYYTLENDEIIMTKDD